LTVEVDMNDVIRECQICGSLSREVDLVPEFRAETVIKPCIPCDERTEFAIVRIEPTTGWQPLFPAEVRLLTP
jgi:hypothetical protein